MLWILRQKCLLCGFCTYETFIKNFGHINNIGIISVWLIVNVTNYDFSIIWIVWNLIFVFLLFFFSLTSFFLLHHHFWIQSINFEMTPSQKCPPLWSAQLVSPPLIGPNSLKVEWIVSSPCGRPCPWADHLQPAQQELGLSPDSYHGQGPPQEGGSYGQLCLFCPNLPLPPLLRASHPHPRDC